jgi:arsenate reductase
MAEGFTRHFGGDSIIAVSAGIEPIPINPMTIEVMREVGIDISGQHAKDVASILKEHFAYVVGVCDMSIERCPIFPFAFKLLKWDIKSPSAATGSREQRLAAFRKVRDQIEENVRQLLVDVSNDLHLTLTEAR